MVCLILYRMELKFLSRGFTIVCAEHIQVFCFSSGTAERQSSLFVGAHRKKTHARKRPVIQMKFGLNT